MDVKDNEKAIRAIVGAYVEAYASGFSDRHISEKDDDDGTINMKINNVFIAALGQEIQYYSALARSLDSSLGNMLEKMAIKIASLHGFDVSHFIGRKDLYADSDFWNYICNTDRGYEIVKGEYNKTYMSVCVKKGKCVERCV